MNKYYRVGFDKRAGGYVLEIMDENFKRTEYIHAVKDNYDFLYRETLLPIDLSDMIQVCKKYGDSVSFFHKTKPLNDKYDQVLEYRDLTDKQLETICDPKKYVRC